MRQLWAQAAEDEGREETLGQLQAHRQALLLAGDGMPTMTRKSEVVIWLVFIMGCMFASGVLIGYEIWGV